MYGLLVFEVILVFVGMVYVYDFIYLFVIVVEKVGVVDIDKLCVVLENIDNYNGVVKLYVFVFSKN